MKKVMIGILILIPIIILLVVAMVSTIVSAQAHIAVEKIDLKYKGTEQNIYDLQLNFADVANKTVNLKDYIDVVVAPKKANNYTIEWKISGDITYTDEEYYNKYKNYLDTTKSGEKVWPAATFVDENGRETASNTSSKMAVASYCNFTVQVVAENVSKTLNVQVVGYDVQRVDLSVQGGQSALEVGSSARLLAAYTPIDSIVEVSRWESSNPSVASVDQNGVVTGKGAGKATITHFASVKSTGEMVAGTIEVEVSANGASTLYGNKLVTSKSSFTLSELGISEGATAVGGCEIVADTVTLTSSVATIKVGEKNFVIEQCAEDDIEIQNARFFEHKEEDGYVLAVGEHTLKLSAIWQDMTNKSAMNGVVWASNNQKIATVNENGEVKGVSSGLVTITATLGAKKATLTINVQNKLASVQLRTNNAYYQAGLARETVFASQKFAFPDTVKTDSSKIANSTLIKVEGEKDGATKEELATFYSAYNFEIVKGGEYAQFDNDVRNKLVFKDNGKALEGKGKQQIVVRVSAKYPKYEGVTKYTTQEVTLNAIYGVAVTTVDQLEVASKYQREYAEDEASGNFKPSTIPFNVRNDNVNLTYRVENNPYSEKTYAICFESSVEYDGEPDSLTGPEDRANFYGDVYGNGYMLSAAFKQVKGNSKLMRISWSNTTLSNLIVRVNRADKNSEDISSAQDTREFAGIAGVVGSHVNWNKYRLENVTLEHCIFENAREGINVQNSDVTFEGCIVRNLNNCGIASQARMFTFEGEDDIMHPFYSHITFNNFAFSNTLASVLVINYENFSIDEDNNYRFVQGNKKKDKDGSLAQANEKWFKENLLANGINTTVTQTGFFDAYNWQRSDSVSFVSTAGLSNELVEMIGKVGDTFLRASSLFENNRIIDADNNCWIHIAVILSGLHAVQKNGKMNIDVEPNYAQISFADKRLHYINSSAVEVSEVPGAIIPASLLKSLKVGIWGYDKNQNIQPTSKLIIDDAYISRLHSK